MAKTYQISLSAHDCAAKRRRDMLHTQVQERVRTCCMDARAFMQLLCQSRASGSACSGSDQV